MLENFSKDSLAVSKAFRVLSNKGATAGQRVMTDAIIGIGTGGLTGNPLAGALAASAANELHNRGTRQLLFKMIESSGVGRAATVGAAEGARRLAETTTSKPKQ